MKVVFWWNIPCAGMIHVLKSYCEVVDTSAIVVTGILSNARKSMGWDDNGKLFNSHIVLQDEEWDDRSQEILEQYKDRLHVFNGITHPTRMKRVIDCAIEKNIKFCNMSEAYSNLNFGLRKLIKTAYIKYYLPHIVRPIAQHSKGIICLSGNSRENILQFKKFGFRNGSIYPFGYYTDEDKAYQYVASDDGKIHILCPGLLEQYKGVDVLIKALSIVSQRGCKNYMCHITGKGSQEVFLKKLVAKFKLENEVIFEGVLDSKKYSELLSHIDMLVAPGRVEPWGIRINEAIQRGNVVIVSDKIGAAELIETSHGGAIFNSGNVKDLAKKLYAFLSNVDTVAEAKKNNREYKQQISCSKQALVLATILSKIQHI